jgi:hypothetical protein
MKCLNIKIPVYNDQCYILWPYDKEEATEWLKKKKIGIDEIDLIENTDAVGSTVYINKKNAGAIIFLKKWNGTPRDYAVLVHEIIHAASFMIDNIGLEESRKVPETLCYLVDYMFEKALKAFHKPTKQNIKPVSLHSKEK